MSESMNQQILLKSRPTGEPQESDFAFVEAEFLDDMRRWLQAGKLKYREDVVQGLENIPRAFIGLLQGKNFGKLVVQVGKDPTKK